LLNGYSMIINKVFLSPLGCRSWQLGFLYLFTFMAKEFLAKRKLNSFFARFERTTTQIQRQCTTKSTNNVS